jgi:hypothetical protein
VCLHRKKAFEKRVVRKIIGPKREEVTGDLSKLHNESSMICVPDQYYSVDQIK